MPRSLPALDNLVRIGQLKAEPRNEAEVWLLDRTFSPVLGAVCGVILIGTMALRYWAVSTLGPRWNTRVIVVPGLGPVTDGPRRVPYVLARAPSNRSTKPACAGFSRRYTVSNFSILSLFFSNFTSDLLSAQTYLTQLTQDSNTFGGRQMY